MKISYTGKNNTNSTKLGGTAMLPIGSIVHVKGKKQKLMILNRGPEITTESKTTMYNYSGCLYPYGLDPEKVYYFNEKDIDKVVFQGYKDEEEKGFLQFYQNWLKKNEPNKKEEVTDQV